MNLRALITICKAIKIYYLKLDNIIVTYDKPVSTLFLREKLSQTIYITERKGWDHHEQQQKFSFCLQ